MNSQPLVEDVHGPPTIISNLSKFDGLMEALEAVTTEEERVRTNGLSSLTFFFGFSTCVATAYMVGAYPASVWIVYAAEALIILSVRVYVSTKKTDPSTMLYFLDFCWIANFAMASLSLFLLFQVISGGIFITFDMFKIIPDLGRVFVLFATGPLGLSIIFLKSALVLHDIEHFSGCFIHLWPTIAALSVKWDPDLLMSTYPGIFDNMTGFTNAKILNLVGLGLLAYSTWWVPFTAWMLLHGRFQSPKRTGKDTVYLNTILTNKILREDILGLHNLEEDDLLDRVQHIYYVIMYMVGHSIIGVGTLSFSAFCFKYKYLHLVFCILLVGIVLYNASVRYEWMMTRRYGKIVQKQIPKTYLEEQRAISLKGENCPLKGENCL
eukprot:CAMPEP_0194290028 /NCGR_PEP_ID=MMETSP0169-20130528/40429_1 /TAXON_ID=218684 /ORGANISM="Corethron pennatum, Strain L29A3" /LENGTH=379 /DNA_ID=CAMNT_0039037505 /DNA_START=20 /DNA_END=1159 /DNA_ORIENTATION=+